MTKNKTALTAEEIDYNKLLVMLAKHYQDSQDLRNTNFDLQSTIESQQKEIEELKRAIEDEKKVCLRVMDYNSELESQLSEVTKERDKYKLAFFNTQQKF